MSFEIYLSLFLLVITSIFVYLVMKRDKPESSVSEIAHEVKEKGAGRSVSLLFASQTGTGESFARQLSSELSQFHVLSQVVDIAEISDYSDFLSKEKLVIFFCSTYGTGEPPDNAIKFSKWLVKINSANLLSNLSFCVFGLGDSSYADFNVFAKKIDKKMFELGAKRLHPIVLGDDHFCIDDFQAWKSQVFQTIFHLNELDIDYKYDSVFDIVNIASNNNAKIDQANANFATNGVRIVDNKYHPKAITLVEKRVMTTDGLISHLEFDASKSKLKYQTADNLGIFPANPPLIVERVAKILNVDLNSIIQFSRKAKSSKRLPFSSPVYIKDVLKWRCDLQGRLKASILKILSYYATEQKEAETLHNITSEILTSYTSQYLNIVDILERFPSIKIPFADFVDIVPKIKPRYYTIASSSFVAPSVHLTVTLLKKITASNQRFHGLCTDFLNNIPLGTVFPAFIRPSSFQLPRDVHIPLIGVGCGCGMAPFRAWVQHNSYLKKNGAPTYSIHLFYGCRKRNEDYIYEDEIKTGLEMNTLTSITPAFSREQEHKIYVQHKIEERIDWIIDMIDNKGACFYICGSQEMATAVRGVIFTALMKIKHFSQLQAKDYVSQMLHDGRLVIEAWTV